MKALLGNTTLSILKDPFIKSKITRVNVSFRQRIFGDDWIADGCVDFSNGNTVGHQKFEGKSFDDVVIQIKAFLDTL